MESLFDLPAHPLFVHAPVVLMPLVALAALALAVRPQWRARFGFITSAGAFVLLVATVLATQSGEAFEEVLDEQGIPVPVEQHAELAETARLFVLLFFVFVIAMVAIAMVRRGKGSAAPAPHAAGAARPAGSGGALAMAGHACAALAVLFGALGTVWMARTGHEGAKAVWDGTLVTDGS